MGALTAPTVRGDFGVSNDASPARSARAKDKLQGLSTQHQPGTGMILILFFRKRNQNLKH
ncbi:hypothetical protein D3OALGA1CA_1558 [Olavius algarvensis associated proteobacterium Delta 3]|nr:hypothetical protein D3OALGA1CA_1558 [Olavius algarvensis associated proteobacterium Delta 3]